MKMRAATIFVNGYFYRCSFILEKLLDCTYKDVVRFVLIYYGQYGKYAFEVTIINKQRSDMCCSNTVQPRK